MRKVAVVLGAVVWCASMVACADDDSTDDDGGTSQVPNPASVYCEEQGGEVEIVTADDGSQSGDCILPDGTRIDEWELFEDAES